jgi:hypothetical protein
VGTVRQQGASRPPDAGDWRSIASELTKTIREPTIDGGSYSARPPRVAPQKSFTRHNRGQGGYDETVDLELVVASEQAGVYARAAALRAAAARRRRSEIALRLRGGDQQRLPRAQSRLAEARRSALAAHVRAAALLESHARQLDASGRPRDAHRFRANANAYRRLAEQVREQLDQDPAA